MSKNFEKRRNKTKKPRGGGDGVWMMGLGGFLMFLSVLGSIPLWGILALAGICKLIK